MSSVAGHLSRRSLAFRTVSNNPPARLMAKSMSISAQQNIVPPGANATWPEAITREQMLAKLDSTPADRFLLVDVRGADHTGGTICGSLNLPSHSLKTAIPTLYTMCKAADVRTIIWYCGSSKGRGPRAARLFGDYITTQEGPQMRSLVLHEGIKGWVKAGSRYTKWMDNYDAAMWESGQNVQSKQAL